MSENQLISVNKSIKINKYKIPLKQAKKKKKHKMGKINLSTDNKKDIEEIHEEYVKGLTFHYCRDVQEAMAVSFGK